MQMYAYQGNLCPPTATLIRAYLQADSAEYDDFSSGFKYRDHADAHVAPSSKPLIWLLQA